LKALSTLILRALLAAGLTGSPLLAETSHAQPLEAAGGMATILWRAPSRQSLAIQRQLNFTGSVTADTSTQSESRSPGQVFILSGQVNVDLLAQTLLSTYGDMRDGGLILRRGSRGEISISTDPSLPLGTIAVDRGGQDIILFHSRAKPRGEDLVQALKPLLK
jgi:hypothetical protein